MAIAEDKNKQAELDALRQQIDDINRRVDSDMTVEPSKEYLSHLEDIPSEIKRSVGGAFKTLSGHFMKQRPEKILKESSKQTQELINNLTDDLTDRQKSLADEIGGMKELQDAGNGSLLTIANSLTDIPEKISAMFEKVLTDSSKTDTISELIQKIEDGTILNVDELISKGNFADKINKIIIKMGDKVKPQFDQESDISQEQQEEDMGKRELKDDKFRGRILTLLDDIEAGQVEGIKRDGRRDRRYKRDGDQAGGRYTRNLGYGFGNLAKDVGVLSLGIAKSTPMFVALAVAGKLAYDAGKMGIDILNQKNKADQQRLDNQQDEEKLTKAGGYLIPEERKIYKQYLKNKKIGKETIPGTLIAAKVQSQENLQKVHTRLSYKATKAEKKILDERLLAGKTKLKNKKYTTLDELYRDRNIAGRTLTETVGEKSDIEDYENYEKQIKQAEIYKRQKLSATSEQEKRQNQKLESWHRDKAKGYLHDTQYDPMFKRLITGMDDRNRELINAIEGINKQQEPTTIIKNDNQFSYLNTYGVGIGKQFHRWDILQ